MIHMLLMDRYDALMSRFWPAHGLAFGALVLRAITVLVFSVGLALLSRRFLEFPAIRLKHQRKPPLAMATEA
jgi:peptidoglycan/LPS O-acetylase OafA/YrhL